MSHEQGRQSRPIPTAEHATAPYVSAHATMNRQQAEGLSPLQKWAARASESQFNAIAGALGGFTSGVVTCPLDVIKTKLQAQAAVKAGHSRMYKGLVGTASVIWREEGLRGMYRGLGPIVLGYLPTWAVWFTVYNKSKVYLADSHRASSTVATNPIWVIKTRLMSQSNPNAHRNDHPRPGNTPTARPTLHTPWHYRSTLDAARKMYSSEGLLSFYSGLTPALLGLTHVAVQFPTYEYLKTKFTGQGMGEPEAPGEQAHWSGILSASILSKILASSATYPHEVIRTRLQTQRRPVTGEQYLQGLGVATPGIQAQAKSDSGYTPKYKGIVMTFRTILREEGWRAFYAGLGTNMMRAVPAATVTMLTYEFVMRELRHARAEGRAGLGLSAEHQ
ncbi:hypothetical protein LLEC1_02126 [Akanthomyces lecanii]|uniref:Mitochondrial thiamine pyrophosphate carrier 1 n=1 Tax=Cordyceps confragosa TaxID=2714763 RepID=A0A179I868_CORDF|nr:hypothetical protein LLEC1_02126 [Akanthomyces lecanii]